VAEIGCGTYIEIGENLAQVTRCQLAGFPDGQVITSAFETWEPDERVDMVLAATSRHWLDPASYPKAWRLPKPGSALANRELLPCIPWEL